MPVVTNIDDLRRMARGRVAKAIFDYADRGSYDELALCGLRDLSDASPAILRGA